MRQPDVAAALWWFGQTHEVVSTGFGSYWRLAWLPRAGSVGEQDAWLWEALQIIKAERSRELREHERRDDLESWRQRKHRELMS
jgi:hypothetical protein